MNGKSDPFVILSFNNKKGGGVTQKKTKVVKKTLEPEWNQEFELYGKKFNYLLIILVQFLKIMIIDLN